MQDNNGNFIDVRTHIRNQGRGKVSPNGNSITVNVELWPHFIAALSSPQTWTTPFPIWGQQKHRDFGRGKFIFPQEILQKNPQEQIFMEHKNFQGIPFILLKTLPRNNMGQGLSPASIGPLLWSQFMRCLKEMEEALIELGLIAREDCNYKAGHKLSLTRKGLPQRQVNRR